MSGAGKMITYFYFDSSDPQKQVPELMVPSLIPRLLQQCVEVPGTWRHYFFLRGYTATTVTRRMFRGAPTNDPGVPQSYIILDALDECTNRTELMNILERMQGGGLRDCISWVTIRK